MTIVQMLKDAAKGLVLGSALFFITPEIMHALSMIQNIAATKYIDNKGVYPKRYTPFSHFMAFPFSKKIILYK